MTTRNRCLYSRYLTALIVDGGKFGFFEELAGGGFVAGEDLEADAEGEGHHGVGVGADEEALYAFGLEHAPGHLGFGGIEETADENEAGGLTHYLAS